MLSSDRGKTLLTSHEMRLPTIHPKNADQAPQIAQ
jgi:hypothetical protein